MTEFELSPMTFQVPNLTITIPEVDQSPAVEIFHDMEPSFTDLLGDHENVDMLDLFVSPITTAPTSEKNVVEKFEQVKQILQEEETESSSNTRGWTVIASKLELDSLSIKLKTRRDAPTDTVPDKMYSSLKYEVHLTAIGESIRKLPFLLARATVVDSETLQKVTVNTGSVLKGDIEASMSKIPSGPTNMVKGMLKIQLNSELSYHHEKRLLCLVVEFFEPEALDSPVIISRSACVKCYARKPNKKHPKPSAKKQLTETASSSKKRKKSQEMEEPSAKKAKPSTTTQPIVVEQSDEFSNFKKRLDDLMDVNATLKDDVRSMCMNYMFEKFVLSDPTLARKVLMPAIVNPFAAMMASQPEQFYMPQPVQNTSVSQTSEPVEIDSEFEQNLLEFTDEFLM